MKRLSVFVLLIFALPAMAQGSFQVIRACQAEDSYLLEIGTSGDVTGVTISPSHTETLEGHGERLQLSIPLENEWAEIRAIGINPAPIEMLALENLAACETGENEANQAEFVTNALMQYAEAIQEWGE